MSNTTELQNPVEVAISAPFFVRGKVVEGQDSVQRSRDLGVDFATPSINLDDLVYPRTEIPPLVNVPLEEIIDFLVETGQRLLAPDNVHMQECFDRMTATHMLPREVVELTIKHGVSYLDKRRLMAVVEQNFPNPKVLDEWIPKQDFTGRKSFVRAFGARLVHVLPGNSPGQAIESVAQGAMVKSINLFKMSSQDPFTMVAILRSMADIDPNHPVVKSMSAIYWRGGDDKIESTLYRPQYFDKIVAWGGGDAINNVVKYLGPGFQLVSFDPKTSISMVGREAFESDETIAQAADLCSFDVMTLNQEACVASRFQYVEGSEEEVDKFSEQLQKCIAKRAAQSGDVRPLDTEMREQIEMMTIMDDDYRVFGETDGSGVVIRSEEPVDFHPINKTANVVRVDSLDDAIKYVNVATQTIGFYPFNRMPDYRDWLASAGAQRIVHLGEAGGMTIGNPHDAMYPMHRFVNWVAHEDGVVPV